MAENNDLEYYSDKIDSVENRINKTWSDAFFSGEYTSNAVKIRNLLNLFQGYSEKYNNCFSTYNPGKKATDFKNGADAFFDKFYDFKENMNELIQCMEDGVLDSTKILDIFPLKEAPKQYWKSNRLPGPGEREEDDSKPKLPDGVTIFDVLNQMGIMLPFLKGPLGLYGDVWSKVFGKGDNGTKRKRLSDDEVKLNGIKSYALSAGFTKEELDGLTFEEIDKLLKDKAKKEYGKDGASDDGSKGTTSDFGNGNKGQVAKDGTTSPIVKTTDDNTGSKKTDNGASNGLEDKLKDYDNKLKDHDKRIQALEDKVGKDSTFGTGSTTTPAKPTPTQTPAKTPTDDKTPAKTNPEPEIILDDYVPKVEEVEQKTTDNSNAATEIAGIPTTSNNTTVEYTTKNYSKGQPQTVEVPNTQTQESTTGDTPTVGASVVESAKDLLGKKDNKSGTMLPKSNSQKITTTTTTSSSSKGFNPVPLAVGLGAAVAGGVGIKAYKDHKENSSFDDENEDSFTNGNRFWTEEEPNVINSEQNDMSGDILFDDEATSPSYEAVDNGNDDSWNMEDAIPENTESFDLLGEN